MTKDQDRKIRNFFEQLRREDERSIPEFHQVLHGKNPPRRGVGWGLWRRPVVVLFFLFLVAGPVLYFSLRDGVQEDEISSELGRWESPTDFLLSFSDLSLDSTLPEIGTVFWEEDDFRNLEN